MSVIKVENLFKYYGDVKAVDGIDFEVREGEVFGFLGPNGAGKTTTIEIIEGYKTADSGHTTVLGLDPHRDRYKLREHIGVMLQETVLYQDLRVSELLRLFASYYHHPADPDALLEMIGLEDRRRVFVRHLSGGQRQRLAFVLALINDPQLLFLDEPTAGMDPQSRRTIWEWIGLARDRGKTVFLTTHYIEEAERLCDRVAIVDHGQIVVLDSPKRLIAAAELEHRIEFLVDGALDLDRLEAMPGVRKAITDGCGDYTLFACHAQSAIRSLMDLSGAEGISLRALTVEGVTLEDVFVHLTGRRIRA